MRGSSPNLGSLKRGDIAGVSIQEGKPMVWNGAREVDGQGLGGNLRIFSNEGHGVGSRNCSFI